jgi:serine/threonine-protein kinase
MKRIGAGGRGEVFEAEHLGLRRPVAIKVVSSKTGADAAERLYREALTVARISHPNICAILDMGQLPDGSPYIVLERLTGETLAERLRRKNKLSPLQVVQLFTQVLSGLQAVHGQSILHRDLKPQNIFLIDRGGCEPLAKVLDFGFAMDVSGQIFSRMTKPGHACGTPQYMSPEQLQVRSLDAGSDIFSVGIMMYEALCGVHPFLASSVVETAANIVREAPRPLSDHNPLVPTELEAIVHRALENDRTRRFATAAEMQRALAEADLGDEPEPESTTGVVRLPQLTTSSSPSPSAF